MPGKGTAVLARFWAGQPKRPDHAEMEFGAVCLPMPGQEVSGDGWGVERLKGKYICTVADGLGHGPDAAIAAHAALAMAKEYRDSSPAELVERAHGALRSTRGAALAVGQIDPARNIVRFCGVGNITATLLRNGERSPSRLAQRHRRPGSAQDQRIHLSVEHGVALDHAFRRLDGALGSRGLSGIGAAPSRPRRRRALSRLQPRAGRCDGACRRRE